MNKKAGLTDKIYFLKKSSTIINSMIKLLRNLRRAISQLTYRDKLFSSEDGFCFTIRHDRYCRPNQIESKTRKKR